jgi:hypothetical protein
VFEVIAELWNSSEFNPIAPPSDCHIDFQVATDCSGTRTSNAREGGRHLCFYASSSPTNYNEIGTKWSGEEGGQENEHAKEPANQDDSASFMTSIATTADDSSPNKTIGSLSGSPTCALQSRAAFLYG